MKRHTNLIALSREHHYGLLLCWKIRQGINFQVNTRDIVEYVLYFYNAALLPHFKEEENEILLYLPDSDLSKQRTLKEHAELSEFITALSPDTVVEKEPLLNIADLLEKHIRFEERELFPYVETILTPRQLESIGKFSSHPPFQENFPNQFWKKAAADSPITPDPEKTIGEIVVDNHRTAQVFKQFGIDFCCGGKKTVREVCDQKGIAVEEIQQALNLVNSELGDTNHDFQNWDIAFLTDYIINVHHRYVKENTQFIVELAQKVANVHGANHPEAIRIAAIIQSTGGNLTQHLLKEEKILFPFIKELVRVQKAGDPLPEAAFGRVSNPIRAMEAEHEHAGGEFEAIRELTAGYQLPADACNSYRILYTKLEEYESDLHQHVHLENNILFPKAIALENTFRAN